MTSPSTNCGRFRKDGHSFAAVASTEAIGLSTARKRGSALRRAAVVEVEHAAEAFAALEAADRRADIVDGRDQVVAEGLMVPFGVVVDAVLGEGASKRVRSEEDHSIRDFAAHRQYEPLGRGVAVRSRRRRSDGAHAVPSKLFAEVLGEDRVLIHDQELLRSKESVDGVREHSGGVDHERAAGVRRRSDDLDRSSRDVDDEERVMRDEAAHRQDLRREEVRRGDGRSVRLEERLPLRLLTALGSRIDARRLERLLDRVGADDVADILERALDAVVAPQRVLLREANGESRDPFHQSDLRGRLRGEGPLCGHESAMPAQNRVWGHDRRDLGKQRSAELDAGARSSSQLVASDCRQSVVR
jgi:hypothetical protein